MSPASRCLVLLAALALASLSAFAQGAPARVGLLGPDEQPRFSHIATGLRQGLREQGHADSAIDIIEARVERGQARDAKQVVERLAAQRIAVLFVIGSSLAQLARDSVPGLPIVFITPGDPVAAGMLASFARPGGDMTALMFEYPELSAKRLELLRELAPTIRSVLVIYDPRDGGAGAQPAGDQRRPGAGRRGRCAAQLRRERRRRGAAGGARARQDPAGRECRRASVERPSKLTLVINLKTAKMLGITVPPAVLLRADHLIE